MQSSGCKNPHSRVGQFHLIMNYLLPVGDTYKCTWTVRPWLHWVMGRSVTLSSSSWTVAPWLIIQRPEAGYSVSKLDINVTNFPPVHLRLNGWNWSHWVDEKGGTEGRRGGGGEGGGGSSDRRSGEPPPALRCFVTQHTHVGYVYKYQWPGRTSHSPPVPITPRQVSREYHPHHSTAHCPSTISPCLTAVHSPQLKLSDRCQPHPLKAHSIASRLPTAPHLIKW